MTGRPPDGVWVITAPKAIAGTYDDEHEYKAALLREPTGHGHTQWVDTSKTGLAILSGSGVTLPHGHYAFTDGSNSGGVGIVLVEQDAGGFSVTEIATSVFEVFLQHPVRGLDSESSIAEELRKLKMGLSELSAPYFALQKASPDQPLIIVYDRVEVEDKLDRNTTKAKSDAISEVILEFNRLRRDLPLKVRFRHKYAHQSEWLGRDDFAHWNNRADELASPEKTTKTNDRWFLKAGLRRTTLGAGQYRFDRVDRSRL